MHPTTMSSGSIEDLQQRLTMTEEALRLSEERSAAGHLALELMHEVKNPLETLGYLNYLALGEHDVEQVKVYLRQAEEQMSILDQIASHTLGFARSLSAPQVVTVSSLIEAGLRIHQRTIERKKIHVMSLIGEHRVKVYPGQILQVLSNLIGNAVDALEEEGHLYLYVRGRRGNIEIVIADDGTGIAPEDRARVFEAFFSTKGASGTGLGLSLSKRIVERHQGRIRMHSSRGPHKRGTVFRVSLPG
jgi:signal transduction histidine kinase